MITCPACNAQIPDGYKICSLCGASLEAPINPIPQAPVYEAPAQPAYQAPVQPVYQAPVQPAYQAPVQPAYQAPVQNPYGQPAQPGFQPNPYGQPMYQQPVQQNKTSMVLGIIGIVFSFLIALVGHATSIPGIVIGYKEYKKNGYKTGLILSIIGESLSVLSSLIGIFSVWGAMGIF